MPTKRPAAESKAADQYAESSVVAYQCYIPDAVWAAWKRTVPRNTTLYERLWTLLEQDTRATTGDGWEDIEERTARLLASRIAQRATNASTALDDDDPERAREELDAIRDIAGQFER